MKSVSCVVATLFLFAMCPSSAWSVDVTEFGAKGDGKTDDTEAVQRALAASEEVHFPPGVYVLSNGIDLPDSAIVTGAGMPKLGTFPLWDDDKRFLTDAELRSLPGTTLLFRGRGTRSIQTARNDQFKNLRYAIKSATGLPYRMERLAVLLDMRVRDEDGVTTADNDRRADYDVGILVDDSPGGNLRDVSVFGYYRKAGLCVVSRGEASNPDYNTFWNCSFSGQYGVALIGSEGEAGPGLSGTQFYGCNLFSNDHHYRKAGQWGSGALLIDGDTSAKHADINGHYFFGGCIRTYANVAVRFGRASNISFHGVVFEVPPWDSENKEGADTTGKFVGTSETRDVMFFGCRMHNIGLRELANTMRDGAVTVAGGAREGLSIQAGQQAVRLHTNAAGDPMVQLTRDTSSINSGWTMRLDVSENDNLVLRYDNHPMMTVTPQGKLQTRRLSSHELALGSPGVQTLTNSSAQYTRARIMLQSAEPRQLTSLEGGEEGAIAILELGPASASIRVPCRSEGNIRLADDIQFDHPNDRLMLLRSREEWTELSRTDFAR